MGDQELEVEGILKNKGVAYRLIPLSGVAATHEDVVKNASGADPEGDCKTIVTKDKQDNLYAFFLRGMMRLDFKKVKEVVGKRVKIVGRDELALLTGREAGAISPLLLGEAKLFVDKGVFSRDVIHFGSGDSRFGLEMETSDLEKVLLFTVVDIVER